MDLGRGTQGYTYRRHHPPGIPLLGKESMIQLIEQVLYDALSHGFVGMNKIALMVFDEGMFVKHESCSVDSLSLRQPYSTLLHWQSCFQQDPPQVLSRN